MEFKGICRTFDLTDERQYESIGQFWDEMAMQYGLDNLQGLGYLWCGKEISYAIGLKSGEIEGCNIQITLPDDGWVTVEGETRYLKELYQEIYRNGCLQYEIETFYENGRCKIQYYRSNASLA